MGTDVVAALDVMAGIEKAAVLVVLILLLSVALEEMVVLAVAPVVVMGMSVATLVIVVKEALDSAVGIKVLLETVDENTNVVGGATVVLVLAETML